MPTPQITSKTKPAIPRRWEGVEPRCSTIAVSKVNAVEGEENVVEFYAEFYNDVNSKGEIFLPGCFSKSVAERVPKGLVKLTDGHLRDPSAQGSATQTIGVLLSATSDQRGLRCRCKIATDDAAQALKQKMIEGIVNSFSIEWHPIQEHFERVDEDTEHYVQVECFLRGVALVPYSANMKPGVISVNSVALEFQNLPLAPRDMKWSSDEAEERICAWADADHTGKGVASVRRSRAYLVRSGEHWSLPIADLNADSKPVAVPDAIIKAAADLEANEDIEAPIRMEAQRHLDRYFARMRAEFEDDSLRAPWDVPSVDEALARVNAAGQDPTDGDTSEIERAARALLSALPEERRAAIITTTKANAAGPLVAPTEVAGEALDIKEVEAFLELELDFLRG